MEISREKSSHLFKATCIAPLNQSRPSPNLGEIISWLAVEETDVHRDDVTCTRFHIQNVAKLRFKPWLPSLHSHFRPPPAWNLRGVRSGEDLSRMPTETQLTLLDYRGTKQEQTPPHLICSPMPWVPHVRPPDVTFLLHSPWPPGPLLTSLPC